MIPKLSGACYAIRLMVHINNINTLKSIFYEHFHSLIKYGIIFWGTYSNSRKIFTLQKKIVRIMAGAQPRTLCRSLFKQLEILPVSCQYMLSLMNFIIRNFFKKIHLYTILKQGISIFFIDQMPTILLSKKYILCWHKNFQQFTTYCDNPQEWQGKI